MAKLGLRQSVALAALAFTIFARPALAACGTDCQKPAAQQGDAMTTKGGDDKFRGYGIAETGLVPKFPAGFDCPPVTSLYASWIDVDGSRRDERHSGIDAGRLGDPIIAPASGKIRRVWVADWGQGREGAILMLHTREELNITDGAPYYYVEYDHLNHEDVVRLKEGQRIRRGEQIASVYRPGGKLIFLPEVHFEVWEVGDDGALTWDKNDHGTDYFKNPTARLIDPLFMLSRQVPPTKDGEVELQPFQASVDYSKFKGFTYFLPCRKKAEPSRER